jgi:transcriptional regulator with XRE-family HTH domain
MNQQNATTIGERISLARRQRGMTQQQLGRLVGKSKQLVSAAENGRSELMAKTAADISRVLSVDLRWILFGGPDPQLHPVPQGQQIPCLSPKQIVERAKGKYDVSGPLRTAFVPGTMSQSAFAYTQADNGMRPELLTGDVIAVDPAQKVNSGSLVLSVVYRDGGTKLAEPVVLVREVRFGSLSTDRPPFTLLPLHEGYPVVEVRRNKDAALVGVVTAVTRILKADASMPL